MTHARLESRAGHRTRRAAGGFAWSAVEIWLRQLLQGASFVLLARLLGPDAWGLFGIALIFITASKVLISEGGWVLALVRTRDVSPDLLDTVFWAAFGTAALFALLIVLAAGPIAGWFGQPEVEPVLCWIAFSVLLEALGVVPRALLMRNFAFRLLAVRSILGMAAAGVVGVGAALAGAGVWSFVGYHLAQALVEAIVLWSAGQWRPGLRVSIAALRRVAAFVGQVFGEKIFTLADLILPRVLLGQQAGPVPLGHYTFARKILELGTQLVVVPINRVALPSFAEAQADRERLHETIIIGVQISAAVSLPIFLGLAIVIGDLVPFLLGQHWTPAVPYVQLAVLLGPAISLSSVLGSLLLALGRSRDVLLQAAAGTALLVAMLAMLPAPSVSGVLVVVLVQAYAILPARLVVAARASEVPLGVLLRRLTPIIIATAAMALAVLGVRGLETDSLDKLPRLLLEVAVGGTVYAGLLAYTDRQLIALVVNTGRSFRLWPPPSGHGGPR